MLHSGNTAIKGVNECEEGGRKEKHVPVLANLQLGATSKNFRDKAEKAETGGKGSLEYKTH